MINVRCFKSLIIKVLFWKLQYSKF